MQTSLHVCGRHRLGIDAAAKYAHNPTLRRLEGRHVESVAADALLMHKEGKGGVERYGTGSAKDNA